MNLNLRAARLLTPVTVNNNRHPSTHTRNINTTQRLEECEGMPREATHFHLHNLTIKCGNFLNVLLLFNCNWYPRVLWWYVPETEVKPVGIQTKRSVRDTKDGLFHILFVLSTILDNFRIRPFELGLSSLRVTFNYNNWLFYMPGSVFEVRIGWST